MQTNIKKLTLSGLLVAVAVIGSTFSFPVGVAKCAPVQHMVNVLAAVILGAWYAVAIAFVTSCIRVSAGLGSLLAFPGSMVGALLAGLIYQKWGRRVGAYLGEIVGTGVLGAILAYPVAAFILGRQAALFGFIIPFSVSSIGGATISIALLYALSKTHVIEGIKR